METMREYYEKIMKEISSTNNLNKDNTIKYECKLHFVNIDEGKDHTMNIVDIIEGVDLCEFLLSISKQIHEIHVYSDPDNVQIVLTNNQIEEIIGILESENTEFHLWLLEILRSLL